jgi:hypothetical protein
MRKGGGKSKGNAFENLIGRKLSLWLTKEEDGTQLISSRQSGGWKHRRERHAGDLAANGPVGERFREHFLVECKHHKKDLLWSLFYAGKHSVPDWWGKAVREANAAKLCPMLVCRQNARPIFVALYPTLAADLATLGSCKCIEYQVGGASACGIILLETLMRWNPEEVYGMLNFHPGK